MQRLLALAALAPLVVASDGHPSAEEPGPAVPLDQLLRLPAGTGMGSAAERRGGHTKSEWQTRFRQARKDEVEARDEVATARALIEKKAGEEGAGQWRMGAPGLGAVDPSQQDTLTNPNANLNNPLDYGLTQRLRRGRENLARAERALQDLEVEANLAGVPQEWRGLPPEALSER